MHSITLVADDAAKEEVHHASLGLCKVDFHFLPNIEISDPHGYGGRDPRISGYQTQFLYEFQRKGKTSQCNGSSWPRPLLSEDHELSQKIHLAKYTTTEPPS